MHNHSTVGKIIVISIFLAVPVAILGFSKPPMIYCTVDDTCLDKLPATFVKQCTENSCIYKLDGESKIKFTEDAKNWIMVGRCIDEKRNEVTNYYECHDEKVFDKKTWNLNEREYNGIQFVIFEK